MKATGNFPTTTFRTVLAEDIQAENLLFLLANGQEKGGIAETEDRILPTKYAVSNLTAYFLKKHLSSAMRNT